MSNDKNNLVYREQLDDNVIEMLSEDIGSNYSLRTENTKTIVAALNEILGKDIICNAIGEPILTTDTFAQMGEKIHVMVNDFKAKLLGLGVSVSSVDKMAALIEKMGEIDLGVDAEELLNPYIESLREILGDEGVELSGEESLAELIVKVDEMTEEMKEREEANRQALIEALIKNGVELEGGESLDELLGKVEVEGGVIIRSNDIKQIACGFAHTIILKNDGSVWACGYNNAGQLGLGDTTDRNTFTQITTNINNDVKQIDCGYYHTFILKNDGSVYSCGRNGSGQLGLNDTTNRNVFTQVTTNINNDVKQVVCGSEQTFILKNDGSVYSCGDSTYGKLGLGNIDNINTFTQVTTNINNDVKQVVCGIQLTFILKNDGSVWACGFNSYGSLGLGDTTNRTTFTQVTTNINNDVKQIACGYYHTFILKNDDSVWSCGHNEYGQLGLGDTTNRNTITQVTININNDVAQIACGWYYTFILKNDGSIWSCGENGSGQLGLNDTDKRTTFTQVTTNINNDVKQIACGNSHTIIIKNDGSVWVCGSYNKGQLGLGDTTTQKTFTKTYKTIIYHCITFE